MTWGDTDAGDGDGCYPPHPKQREVALDPACSSKSPRGRRRWGKTRLRAALCIMTAGKGGRAWWVAPLRIQWPQSAGD